MSRYPFYSCNDLGGYGSMIFSKYPCLFFELKFISQMDRSLLLAEPIHGINGKRITIATSHFESQNNPKMRKRQMEAAFSLFGQNETILVGDFNFDNK